MKSIKSLHPSSISSSECSAVATITKALLNLSRMVLSCRFRLSGRMKVSRKMRHVTLFLDCQRLQGEAKGPVSTHRYDFLREPGTFN
jgi:hypothetical protein